jgi:glutathione synthase/RimK-type ligase-like ATP-grasp enzyme
MKLILANNQSERFRMFYSEIAQRSAVPFDYDAYENLLFIFDTEAQSAVQVQSVGTGRSLDEYDGVYLNGYLSTYELAGTTATCCLALGVQFVNRELIDAPSLSKLSAHAKLAKAGVRTPRTVAGSKNALTKAKEKSLGLRFPAVLKRADADRGIDNFKVQSMAEVLELLRPHEPRSLWILQEFVPNDGFYLVTFYDQRPEFSIYRSLEARPDGNEQKAHMYKPKGGSNAHYLPIAEVPAAVSDMAQRAIDAMNRQIGSVDCLYEPSSDRAYVLEVNYNPQLVTIETLKDLRIEAFLKGIQKIGE